MFPVCGIFGRVSKLTFIIKSIISNRIGKNRLLFLSLLAMIVVAIFLLIYWGIGYAGIKTIIEKKSNGKTISAFNPQTFQFALNLGFTLVLAWIGLIMLLRKTSYAWKGQWFFSRVIETLCFRFVHGRDRLILFGGLVLVMAWRVYCHLQIPVHVDEAFSFLYSTSKGPLVTLAYFPGPNNHVGYNFVTSFFHYLPFDDLTEQRFVAVFVSLILFLYSYRLIVSKSGHWLAVMVAVWLSMVFSMSYYGVLARGYSALSLFALLYVHGLIKLRQTQFNKGFFLLFLGTFLGVSFVPVFLFLPIITVPTLLHVIVKNRQLKEALVWGGFTVLALITWYFPIVSFNGWRALIQNPWYQSTSKYLSRDIFNAFAETLTNWFYIKGVGIWLLGVVSAMVLIKIKASLARWLCLGFLLLMIFLYSFEFVPPFRSLLFLLPAFFVFMALWYKIRFNLFGKILGVILAIHTVYSMVSMVDYQKNELGWYAALNGIVDELGNKKVLVHVQDTDLYSCLLYLQQTEKLDCEFILDNSNSKRKIEAILTSDLLLSRKKSNAKQFSGGICLIYLNE